MHAAAVGAPCWATGRPFGEVSDSLSIRNLMAAIHRQTAWHGLSVSFPIEEQAERTIWFASSTAAERETRRCIMAGPGSLCKAEHG